jgi:glycosyltransferase involved in cell wall biosynthesis
MSSGNNRVAMIVANDVTNDARVKKSAYSVAHLGFDVTIIAVARDGVRSETSMGPVSIVRVPVRFALRDKVAREQAAESQRHPVPGAAISPAQGGKERREEKVRLEAERLDLEARIGAYRLRQSDAEGPPKPPHQRLTSRLRRELEWRRLSREREHLRRAVARFRAEREAAAERRAPAPHLEFMSQDWRELVPETLDFERAYEPVLRDLQPLIIHAHDFPMIGTAVRHAQRAGAAGRRIRVVYDAHEYTAGVQLPDPRRTAGYQLLEREYIRAVDAVITVSEGIANRLEADHTLRSRPAVVLNVPYRHEHRDPSVGDVRRVAGLPHDLPLVVYSGNIAPERRLDVVVQAIEQLEEVHLVIVTDAAPSRLRAFLEPAESKGYGSRIHVVPYTVPDRVVEYLSTATLGVHALSGDQENHQLALPNKLFEYLHAGLPVVVSATRAMEEFVVSTGIGEVFRPGDAKDLSEKIEKVLRSRETYVERTRDTSLLERFSWQGQEVTLAAVYQRLSGIQAVAPSDEPMDLSLTEQVDVTDPNRLRQRRQDATHRLAIGPANMAGQAWEWARALEASNVVDVAVEVFGFERDYGFPADHQISSAQWRDLSWQVRHAERLLSRFTHVLFEAGLPLLGTLNGNSFENDVPSFRAHGIQTGMILHGSEVRSPRIHRRLEPHSPLGPMNSVITGRLQLRTDELGERLQRFTGDVFVTTLGLFDFVGEAHWLPIAVDQRMWKSKRRAFSNRRPVVAHIPTNGRLKGAEYVAAACLRLSEEGVIDYRPLRGIPYADMPAALGVADIVVDGLLLGDYGVTACQAMAAGRLVLGNVSESVRNRLPGGVPIVQATPDTLDEVLTQLLDQPQLARERAALGPTFVERYHDGRLAAKTLGDWIVRTA